MTSTLEPSTRAEQEARALAGRLEQIAAAALSETFRPGSRILDTSGYELPDVDRVRAVFVEHDAGRAVFLDAVDTSLKPLASAEASQASGAGSPLLTRTARYRVGDVTWTNTAPTVMDALIEPATEQVYVGTTWIGDEQAVVGHVTHLGDASVQAQQRIAANLAFLRDVAPQAETIDDVTEQRESTADPVATFLREVAPQAETIDDVTEQRESTADPVATIYSKPGCYQCEATKKVFDKQGLPYTDIDVTTDPQARQKILDLGYTSIPVVIAGDAHWAGFRPDRVGQLRSQLATSGQARSGDTLRLPLDSEARQWALDMAARARDRHTAGPSLEL